MVKLFKNKEKRVKIKNKNYIIEDSKKQQADNNADDYKNELIISKEREIFKNIYNERLDKLEELTKKINFDNLKYFTESTNMETDFSAKENPITFHNNIKTNRITRTEAKDTQEDFNKYLKMIQRGNKTDQEKKCCQILICF